MNRRAGCRTNATLSHNAKCHPLGPMYMASLCTAAANACPVGSKNFITREVKEAIIAACNKIGSDGHGRDGLEGYLEFLGRHFPPQMAGLLRAIMPTQITVERKERPAPYKTYAEMCADLERQYGIKLDKPLFQLQYYKGPWLRLTRRMVQLTQTHPQRVRASDFVAAGVSEAAAQAKQ